MDVVEPIGARDHALVESIVAGLVAADAAGWRRGADRRRRRCATDRLRSARAIRALSVPRAGDRRGIRKRQLRTALLQHGDDRGDVVLRAGAERLPPGAEFVGVLDPPGHDIPSMEYRQEARNHGLN